MQYSTNISNATIPTATGGYYLKDNTASPGTHGPLQIWHASSFACSSPSPNATLNNYSLLLPHWPMGIGMGQMCRFGHSSYPLG
jgi:hypothetical protein